MAVRGADVEPTPSVSQRATARPIDALNLAQVSPAIQLALELETELPRLALEPEWKAQPRLWGHSLHPMCSYLASFPAALSHAFIARYSRPGDVVLDPFSGRGTAPLQAAAEGRIGVGNDLNPFAHLLTAAKVEPPDRARGADSARTALRLAWRPPARWRDLAGGDPGGPGDGGPGARARRGRDRVPPADLRPAAVPAGRARPDRPRGPVPRRGDRRASSTARARRTCPTLMPNTFSMAPRYVRDFAARTGFTARRARRLRRPGREARPPVPRTRCRSGPGSRSSATRATPAPARASRSARAACRTAPGWSSPRRRTCASSSTATTTGCGRGSSARTRGPSTPPSTTPITARRTSSSCATVLHDLRPALTDDAIVVLVIGDVATDRGRTIRNGIDLAERVWEAAAAPEGYRLAGVAARRRPRPSQDDEAVGRRGGPRDPGRPDPRPRSVRGRAPARALRGRPPRRLDLAAAPPRALTNRPMRPSAPRRSARRPGPDPADPATWTPQAAVTGENHGRDPPAGRARTRGARARRRALVARDLGRRGRTGDDPVRGARRASHGRDAVPRLERPSTLAGRRTADPAVRVRCTAGGLPHRDRRAGSAPGPPGRRDHRRLRAPRAGDVPRDRPASRASGRRRLDPIGLATMRPCSRCTTRPTWPRWTRSCS